MPTGPTADFSTGAGYQVFFPYKTPLSPYNTSAPVRSKGSLGKLGVLPSLTTRHWPNPTEQLGAGEGAHLAKRRPSTSWVEAKLWYTSRNV